MNQPAAAVPMVVLTRHQDHVETINKTLRNAGHPVHLSWLPDASDLGDALTQISPEMLIVFADEGIVALPEAMDFRARFAPEVPVILVHERVDEAAIAAAIKRGAQDAVTLADLDRLQLVVTRELRTFRLNRALGGTLNSAREYRRQLQDVLAGSADAIAHVQEGIVVDANPAWLQLFGCDTADSLLGTPLMDTFDPHAHAALKGALVACAQGKWAGHPVRATALLAGRSTLDLELRLDRAEFDGEPCVRLSVTGQRSDPTEMERRLTEAVQRDPATGLLHRRYFLDALRRRLGESVKAGVRLMAYLEPDKYDAVVSDIGIVAAEDFQTLFAALVREQLQPGDIAGVFGGHGIMVLLERGTARDAEAWALHVVKQVREELFQVGDKSLSTTCTVGLATVPASLSEPDAPATEAFRTCRAGHQQGGNRLAMPEQAEKERRSEDADRQWVRQIKAALMENRFRLVQQPIASLLGDDRSMFDVLVRMLDEKGGEILPSEFMAAAERHDLMKNIDRWVIGASMQFTASRRPGALFVRLSRDSVIDPSLGIWLQNQLKTTKIEAARIVFQVAAEVAVSQLKPVVDLQRSLHAAGFRFAIEGFGGTRDPEQLLGHLKPDFVKIHGSLIQGLATDQEKQTRVKDLVDLARARGAVTVAERVEDANTMAVLWQLGVEYIQGFFVNVPEEVVLG